MLNPRSLLHTIAILCLMLNAFTIEARGSRHTPKYSCQSDELRVDLYGWGEDADYFGDKIPINKKSKIVLTVEGETYTYNNIIVRTDGGGNASFFSVQPDLGSFGLTFAAELFYDHEGSRIEGRISIPVLGEESELEDWRPIDISPENCTPEYN